MMNNTVPIFIPSYKRADNLKTVRYFVGLGYPAELIYVFIDSEADDKIEYERECKKMGCHLHIFDMDEARARYDYVHRASISRRSAGQARNMFYDFAKANAMNFYVVQDDDTNCMQIRPFGKYFRLANIEDITLTFEAIREMMEQKHIGLFGLSQTGDIYINTFDDKLFRPKVMNTTFVNVNYIYRGEKGVQDDDTSMFAGAMNEGLFTGSLAYGLVLLQTPSAQSKGGLTDLYNECKLLNKSLVTVIQFPSAIYAERQLMNGGRIHHHITNRYIMPRIIKNPGGRSNIAWDTYPEDVPFTNEPKRK